MDFRRQTVRLQNDKEATVSKRFELMYGGKPIGPKQAEQYLPYKARKIRQMAAAGEFGKHGVITETVARGDREYTRYFIYPAAIEKWIRDHSQAA
jgi:hypothetical protein